MTDELQGIVNRLKESIDKSDLSYAATNYTNKKRPVLCYITQNRAIKKEKDILGKRRPGSVHRDGYMREVSRTLLL